MFEEFESRHGKIKKLPLYQKGKEIMDVVLQITELIPENEVHLNTIKRIMLEDARVLTVKVVGAEAGDLYDLRMECATIIRKAARNLMVQNHTLEMFDFEHTGYFDIVRKLIDEYRLLFIDWVAGFDKWNYVVDNWGLFNPPGIGPDDADR